MMAKLTSAQYHKLLDVAIEGARDPDNYGFFRNAEPMPPAEPTPGMVAKLFAGAVEKAVAILSTDKTIEAIAKEG